MITGKKYINIRKLCLLTLLLFVGISFVIPSVSAADEFSDDVIVVNKIIDNNGLKGYDRDDPESWDFAKWDTESSPKRVISLNLSGKGLTGNLDISGFTALEFLDCSDNQLTSLDVNDCAVLEYLYSDDNKLANVNMEGLSVLKELNLYNNRLTSLDISGLTTLTGLDCGNNNLTSLDISGLFNLEELYCDNNQLTSLDVSGFSLTELYCGGNPVLEFTAPDGNKLSVASMGTILGSSTDYVGYDLISKTITLTAIEMAFEKWEFSPNDVELTAGSFTDTEISFVLDRDITVTPKSVVIEYDQDDVAVINAIIDSNGMTGYNTNDPSNWDFAKWDASSSPRRIIKLDLPNKGLTGDLDVSELTVLEILDCSANYNLKSLTLPESLTYLDCNSNALTSLTLPTYLTYLDCSYNNLTSLDVSDLTALKILSCYDSQLTSLNVSDLTALTELYCDFNQLKSLEVNGCTGLEILSCSDNQLKELDVSDLKSLTELYCSYNQLSSLDVSGFTKLTELFCLDNQLTNLDVTGCTALINLYCDNNQLTSLDVSDLTSLTELNCDNNSLKSLDASGLTSLKLLYCRNNQLENLNVNGCTALTLLYCSNNNLTNLDVSGLRSMTYLTCSNNQLANLDVSNLPALKGLYCDNNSLTILGVSDLTALIGLVCTNNQLTNLDVSGSVNLEVLYCDDNQLTTLEVSHLNKLSTLVCSNNQLTALDVSNINDPMSNYTNPNANITAPKGLKTLNCDNNQLTSLKLPDTLAFLHCSNNQLTNLDMSDLPLLMELYCNNNLLTSLDLFDLSELLLVYCSGNPIQEFTAPDGNKLSVANAGAVLGVPGDNEPWSTGNYGYDLASKTITLTAIPDSGKSFVSWGFSPDSVMPTAGTLTDIQISFVLDQDITVTLIDSSSTSSYTVTFNSDGGTSVPSQNVNSSGLVIQPDDPVKDGYTFVEWQLNGTAYDFSAPVASDLMLVAVYTVGNPYWDGSDGLSESHSGVTSASGGSGSADSTGLTGEAHIKLTNDDGSSIEANSKADHNSSSANTTGTTSTGMIIESSSSSTGSGSTSNSSVTLNGDSGWSNSTAGSLFTINVRYYENGVLLPALNTTVSVWAGYSINEANVTIPADYELVSFAPTLPATMANNSVLRVNIAKI
jgi:Leucine-rich repeat (LRR) protein